jgi:DNA-binding beta-propeller fold protein YncE
MSTVASASTRSRTIPVPSQPDALVRTGNIIWVASCSGDAITEINAGTKRVSETLSNVSTSSYEFDCPDALAIDGSNIWVANYLGDTMTEFNSSTGALVRIISGIESPRGLAVNGPNIWVLNGNPSLHKAVLTEFNTGDGSQVNALIDEVTGNGWTLVSPTCIVSIGNKFWVGDSGAMEFSSASGKFIGTLRGAGASCITYDRGRLWVCNGDDRDVLEYNASTRRYIKVIDDVPFADYLVSSGNDLFVIAENPGDSVREYDTSNDKLVGVIDRSNVGHDKGIGPLLVDGASLWAANYSAGTVTVIPLRH